ncbi:acetyl esterase/lipase [Conyzicola lurida]|uniref:Acetyl esterase/lipase n=1 Tax=Conyzicola lurida TaxID=1172621 RepID=A0A841AST8_9MICO|nr:alpha/beta hydrolase fold domain-containing protein [Conyzicola lurida]MBB5844693.1 acetyl esterase/lipase [Conyzicola lurida]
MLTLPRGLVPIFLRVAGANRTFVSAAGAHRKVRERELRPSTYGPPSRLRPDVRVDVVLGHDWPVYTVSPRRGTPTGSVVYVHGGGWVNQIVLQHWQLAAQIAAESNTTVILPIYPLVPFGTATDAAAGVSTIVRESIERYGSASIAGDSAGGQIALSVAQVLRDEHGVVLPRTVLISPALDLTWSNPRIPAVQPTDPWLGVPGGRVLAEKWRGDLDLLDPLVSPLAGDLAGLGPITLFSGTRDVLNPDAHLLVERARVAGVELDFQEGVGDVHVYPLLPIRSGRDARAVIVAALGRAAVPR